MIVDFTCLRISNALSSEPGALPLFMYCKQTTQSQSVIIKWLNYWEICQEILPILTGLTSSVGTFNSDTIDIMSVAATS